MNTEVQPEVNEEVSDEALDSIASGVEIQEEQQVQQEPEAKEEQQEKVVPLAALHESRAINRELRQKMQTMEQRFAQIAEKLSPQQPQIPSVDESPVEHFTARMAQLEQIALHQQQTQQQSQLLNQVMNAYSASATQFKQTTPDFTDAYNYLLEGRANQYAEAGYSKQDAEAMVKREEFSVITNAMQMGGNPAAFIYNLALANGYTKKEAKAEQDKSLEMIEKGMKANKSLGTAPGKGADNMTLEALSQMGDEEFDKYWDTIVSKS